MSEPTAKRPALDIPTTATAIASSSSSSSSASATTATWNPFTDMRPFELLKEFTAERRCSEPTFEVFRVYNEELCILPEGAHLGGAIEAFQDEMERVVFRGDSSPVADSKTAKERERILKEEIDCFFNRVSGGEEAGFAEFLVWFLLPQSPDGHRPLPIDNEEGYTAADLLATATRADYLRVTMYMMFWAIQFKGDDDGFVIFEPFTALKHFMPEDFAFTKTKEFRDFAERALATAREDTFVATPLIEERAAWWFVPKPTSKVDQFLQLTFLSMFGDIYPSDNDNGVKYFVNFTDECIAKDPGNALMRMGDPRRDEKISQEDADRWKRIEEAVKTYFGTTEEVPCVPNELEGW